MSAVEQITPSMNSRNSSSMQVIAVQMEEIHVQKEQEQPHFFRTRRQSKNPDIVCLIVVKLFSKRDLQQKGLVVNRAHPPGGIPQTPQQKGLAEASPSSIYL